MAKATKNSYKPAKRIGNYKPVKMAEGGNVSELGYSERREYIEENYAPFITDAQMIFSIYDSGIEYDYKGDRKEVVNSIIESYKELGDYTETTLPQETIYEIQDWDLVRKEIDPETDEVIGETPLKELSADNTYNFSYNGLVDLNWKVYHDEDYDRFFYVITPHLGGDIRGNYGDAIILEGNDKDDLFYRFYEGFISGGASIYFKFKDGSEIGFDSEQDSDVFYFRVNEGFDITGMAQKYLNDFEKFESWQGDEFLEETIDIYLARKGVAPKMMAGGSLNDETPKAYIQILGYDEGKWLTITDYSDGQDVIDAIGDWMNDLNQQLGGNREEFEVADYEGFGDDLYDQYMSSNEFDEIIEAYEKYESSDFPADVISAYKKDSGSRNDSLSDVIDEMDNNYFGKYDNLNDFGYEMVEQGVYQPSENDVFITHTDKRILAGEESDSLVDEMSFENLMNVAPDTKSEYEDEKSELEDKILEIKSEIDDLTYLQTSADDDDEYEIIASQIEEKEVELDDVQSDLDDIDNRFEDKAREEARESFYDEIHDRLENDLEGWLSDYGYDTDNLADVSFISVDYEKIGNELSSDYLIVEFDGEMYFFNNYAKGGRIMASKRKPKYAYYIVENSTKKLVSGYPSKAEAIEQRKLLIQQYPSMRFEIYPLANLEAKTDLDVYAKKDYVELSTLDKIKKVSVDAYRYGQDKVGQAQVFLEKNDVKGKIKRGARKVADKTKQGASWLQKQWREADFGDGKGKAKYFADGGMAGDKKPYEITLEDVFSFATQTKVVELTDAQYKSVLEQKKNRDIVIDRYNSKQGIHEQLRIKSVIKNFADGGGIESLKVGSKVGFLRPRTGRYEYAEVLSIDGDNVNLVVRHPKRSQWDNYFTETKERITKFLNTPSEDWKDGRPVFKVKYADGGYPTKLNIGSIIQGVGFTMLKGLEGGKFYKVVDKDSYSATFIESDENGKIKKNKKLVRHYLSSLDGGISTVEKGNENGFLVVKYADGGGVATQKARVIDYYINNADNEDLITLIGVRDFPNLIGVAEKWVNNRDTYYDKIFNAIDGIHNRTWGENKFVELGLEKFADGGEAENKVNYAIFSGDKKLSSVYLNDLGYTDKYVGRDDKDADNFGMKQVPAPRRLFVFRDNSWISFDSKENALKKIEYWKETIQKDDRYTDEIKKSLIKSAENLKKNIFPIKYADGGMAGLGEVSGMLPNPLPMSTITPMANGGRVQSEIINLDNRIHNLEELVVVVNEDEKAEMYATINTLKKEKENLIKKGNKSEEVKEKKSFFGLFAEGGEIKSPKDNSKVHFTDDQNREYDGRFIEDENMFYIGFEDKGGFRFKYEVIDWHYLDDKNDDDSHAKHEASETTEQEIAEHKSDDSHAKHEASETAEEEKAEHEYDVYDNKRMLENQAKEVEHHSEELNNQVEITERVPAWVIAKMERATTDLSDITHYLDGENKMANGGNVGEVKYEILPHINKFIVAKVTYKQQDDYTYPSKEFIYGFNDKVLEFNDMKSAQKFIDNIEPKYPYGIPKANVGMLLLASELLNKKQAQQPQQAQPQVVYYIPQPQPQEVQNTGIVQDIPEMANGGYLGNDDELKNDFCITNLIELANELQSVKYFVTDRFKENDIKSKNYKGRLIIVFKEPASVNVVNSINKFIERAEDCHHIFEQSVNVSGSEPNSLSINLLSDKFSDTEFNKGGKVYDYAPKKINLEKTKKITTHLGDYNLGLITNDFVYFVNLEEGDDNANTIMYNKKGELLSDNYFASNDLFEVLEKESTFEFIHPEVEYNRQEILKGN